MHADILSYCVTLVNDRIRMHSSRIRGKLDFKNLTLNKARRRKKGIGKVEKTRRHK